MHLKERKESNDNNTLTNMKQTIEVEKTSEICESNVKNEK